MKVKIIFESDDYYNAIWEVQSQIRDKLKYEKLSRDYHDALEWVNTLLSEELDERKLKHYWTD